MHFLCLFVTKTVLKVFSKWKIKQYRFGYKNACKCEKNLEMKSMDHKLSESGLRMFVRRLDRILWFLIVPSIFSKIAKNPLFSDFHQISKKLKIRSRNDLKMPGTFLESLRSIFFEKINYINKLCIFVSFCNQNGIA